MEKANKIVECPNCGREVQEFRLIQINVGKTQQCFCPKCYGYGSRQADVRNKEMKLLYFNKYKKSRGKRTYR